MVESQRFDALVKRLSGVRLSRSQAVRGLAGGALLLLGAVPAEEVASARTRRRQARERKKAATAGTRGARRTICHCASNDPASCTTLRLGKRGRRRHLRHECDYEGECIPGKAGTCTPPIPGCTQDGDCAAPTPFCVNRVCVECRNDVGCTTGYVCRAGVCVAGCASKADCPAQTPACVNGACVACARDSDCGVEERCVDNTCVPACPDLQPSDDLQAAIDATPAGGVLNLCPGTWLLTSPVSVAKDLTVRGAGTAQSIIDGGGVVRVLEISQNVTARVEDLTVTNGHAESGGGIYTQGTLRLTEVAVTDNTAVTGGGGIHNDFPGALTLQAGSRVSGNRATDGGGIFNEGGTVTLESDSRVADNDATSDGGGIRISNGLVTLRNRSRVSGNTALGGGGGIYNFGTLMLETGSIVGGDMAADANSARVGGGIYNSFGEMTLQDGSRVTGNSAIENGGGIASFNSTETVGLGALICNNAPSDKQCAGSFTGPGACPNPSSGICPA